MQKEYSNNYLSKNYICMQLHAMAEVMSVFFSEGKTLRECCAEFNVSNLNEMKALAQLIILINNFSEQKDENHSLTRDVSYIKDEFSAFNFNYVQVLSGNNSSKQIIKEIRDAFEHKSYYINVDGKIFIHNKRTGFKAIVDATFLTGSFFYYLDANNMNNFFLDDSNLNYNNSIKKILEELKIYRVIAKQKRDIRNIDSLARQDLKAITQYFTYNRDYDYVKVILNNEEKSAIIDFFKTHTLNKENLVLILSIIKSSGPVLSNNVNRFIFLQCHEFEPNSTRNHIEKSLKKLKDFDAISKRNNDILRNLFRSRKYCENYFKLLFARYVFSNVEYDMTSEDIHVRNCLSHVKYSWINFNQIFLQDHPNGIRQESNITFSKKYDIEVLYQKANDIWLNNLLIEKSKMNVKLK